MLFITLGMFGQPMIGRQVIDMSQYGGIESFPLEMVYFHTDREIENDSIYSLGGGYYMTKISGVPDFTVKFNFDRSKAIIVGHQPFFMYSNRYNYKKTEVIVCSYSMICPWILELNY